MNAFNRGDVFDADLHELGVRPVVLVSRQEALPHLSGVVAALVTSTVRGHRAEVPVGTAQGLDRDCAVNCDNLLTVPKQRLLKRRGALRFEDLRRLDAALKIALGID